jgi:signal transduction histidine kinase/CheY-like chemotaxis protein
VSSFLGNWLTSSLDWFIPADVSERPDEGLFRARVAVGIACIAALVFSIFALVRALGGQSLLVVMNVAQALTMSAFPFALRRTGRLELLVRLELGAAFVSFVGVSVLYLGGGLSMPTMGLAILPLLATLLSGRREGGLWAVAACVASAGLGFLARAEYIAYRRSKEGLLAEHTMLLVVTLLLYLVGVLYEHRKRESLERIAILERARHAADRDRIAAEAKAHVAEADRLAALGQITAMAAHEINNPLSYVTNNLEHLERWAQSSTAPADVREAGRDAMEGVARIRRIVDDLRNYARPDDGDGAIADARQAVTIALKTAEGHTRPRARVVTRFDDVPPVYANQSRLVQVVLNFVVNAAQAIPEGRAAENEIAVRVFQRPDDHVVIEVEDTGPGIPDSIIGRVKEPFFTTKGRGEGSGLGLALSDHVLQRFGGSLEIMSGPRGAVVRAVLNPAPRDAAVPAPQRALMPSLVPVSTASLSVLVVDDEKLVARALARRLREHHLTIVGTGREALELLDGGARFDAILCDLMMPELTGMDVYDLVLERHPDAARRMVFMSGGTFTENARRFRQRVARPFLDKPLEVEKVRETLRALVEGPGERVSIIQPG